MSGIHHDFFNCCHLRCFTVKNRDADEPTIMSKLLSNTYEKEWFEKLSNSQLKPAQNTKNFLTTTNNNSSGKQFSTSNESRYNCVIAVI